MKVSELTGFLCEFSDEEIAKIEAIAKRDGISLEQALEKAIENFLSAGVQTPNNDRGASAA